MTNAKKYDFRLIQVNDLWTVEITRRASVENTVVSKRQEGFATEAEAQAWGKKEVDAFLVKHKEKDQQRSKERAEAKNDRERVAKQRPTRVAKSPWDNK